MSSPNELPDHLPVVAVPDAVRQWFELVAGLPEGVALVLDGEVLDGLGVRDEESARRALTGYRLVLDKGTWVDAAVTGMWNADWIVLDSVGGDPLIGDLSSLEVPVLRAPHGVGGWHAVEVAASLPEFIGGLSRSEPVSEPIEDAGEPIAAWSVWVTDLGPHPLQTLAKLQRLPFFPPMGRSEVLSIRRSLPFRLLEDRTESAARNAVQLAATAGAELEARTFLRGGDVTEAAKMFEGLFRGGNDDYLEPAPSDQLIASVETELGFRLPAAYIALAQLRNGGVLARTCIPTTEPTGWADDHVAVTGLLAIGRTATYSLCGSLGSTFMRDEWGYPAWGVGIADTPTAGHEQVMLDYRECGPEGEPRVVYVDQEDDYRVTVLAPDFASFIRGLVDEVEFDDSEAERAAAVERVERGSFSPLVRAALDADPALSWAEGALRRLGRAIVDDKGYFAVHADARSRLLLDAMLLLHTRLAKPADFEQFLHGSGPTGYEHPSLELMLFATMIDEPYGFCTRGYAPGFIEDWWQNRIERGSLERFGGTWALSPAAEKEVLGALAELQ